MGIASTSISHAEIHLQGQLVAGGSNSVNTDYVFHYRRTSTVPPLSKPNLDTIFQSTVAAKIILAVNVRWSQLTNTIRWLDDATDPPIPISHVNLGAIVTDGMSAVEAAFILLKTGLRGKSYRGGKHFAGLNEVDTTAPNDDVLNAAAIVLWGNVVTALGTALVDASGNTWYLEVMSRTLSQLTVNPTTVVGNDVNQILLNKRIGRMRGRQPKSVY